MDLVVLPEEPGLAPPALLPTAVRDALPRLFVETTMPLALVDAVGRLLAVNSSFCALVARHAATLAGTRLGDLVHADERVAHVSSWASLLGGVAHADRTQTRLLRPDGSEVPVVVYRTVLVRGSRRSGPLGLAALHDESAMLGSSTRSAQLLALARAVATAADDGGQVGEHVARTAAGLLGDGAVVYERDPTDTLVLRGAWHRDPARRERLAVAAAAAAAAADLAQMVRDGALLQRRGDALRATAWGDAWRHYVDELDVGGVLLTPLHVQDRVTGALLLVSDTGRGAYDDDEVETAGTIAEIAASALGSATQLAQARSDRQLTRAVLDAVPDMAAVLDRQGRVIDLNAAWARGWPGQGYASVGLGSSYLDVCDNAAAMGMGGAAEVAAGVRDVIAGVREVFRGDWAFRCPSGAERWFQVHAARVAVDGVAGLTPSVVVGHHDVTDRKELEVRLAHEATHDPLTGLPNRTLLADRIDQALVRDRRAGVRTAVLFCDLDEFKSINDSYGHDGGDAVLRGVARRFARTVRASDTVARIGGDEFVVLIESVTDVEEALLVADKLVLSLREPDEEPAPGEPPLPAVSVGVAVSTTESSADALLREADAAMYAAKQSGRGRVQVAGTSVAD